MRELSVNPKWTQGARWARSETKWTMSERRTKQTHDKRAADFPQTHNEQVSIEKQTARHRVDALQTLTELYWTELQSPKPAVSLPD